MLDYIQYTMATVQEAASRSVAAGAISAAAGLFLTGATGAAIALPLLAAAVGLDVAHTRADRHQRKQIEDAFRRLINHGQTTLDEVIYELHQRGIDEALAQVTPGDLNDRLTALADLGNIITESSKDQSRRLRQIESWLYQQASHLDNDNSMLTSFIAENTSDIRTLLCSQHADLVDRFDALGSQLEDIKRETDASHDTGIAQSLLHRFGSRIQAVTSALAEPLDTSRDVLRYYKGEYPLTWGVIAAGAVVERDAYSALMETLRDGTPHARLICLVGEPGSGKSSMAWQSAYDLASNNDMVVLHLRDDADGEVWYQLPQLQQELDRPLVVLSDDVFRGTNPAGAISSIPSFLPITIIATSRTNELVSQRQIEMPFNKIPVGPVTSAERERIATRLGVSQSELNAEQSLRIETETDILVLMMEATGSRGHRELLSDVARRLRSQNECLFQAFEYVCHSHAYDLSVPASLIDRLDPTGHCHDLLSRQELDGLLFANARSGWLSTSHSRRAAIIVEETGRSPCIVINEMLCAAKIENDEEAIWSVNIISSIANAGELELARELYAKNRSKMETLQRTSPRFYWLGWEMEVQRTLNWANHAELDRNLAIADEWLTRHDHPARARILMYQLLQQLGYSKALRKRLHSDRSPFEERWNNSHTVQTWLGMVTEICDAEQITNALDSTESWLADHPQDTNVRQFWLEAVKRAGDTKRITNAIDSTNRWLTNHPASSEVRISWLGMVERTGDAKHITAALDSTKLWLANHPRDSNVREFWLRMVERTGDTKLISEALGLTEHWLADNLGGSNVRCCWFGMVERTGDTKHIAEAIDQTERWLANHPQDNNVRPFWLGVVERTCDAKHTTAALDSTKIWLANHPLDTNVRRFWLGMVERTGDAKHITAALDSIKIWLANHRRDSNVRGFWLGMIERSRYTDRIIDALDATKLWLDDHPADNYVRQFWLGMTERTHDPDRISYALESTERWLTDYPHNSNVLQSWLSMVERKGDAKHVTDALNSTKLWLAEHPQNSNVRTCWLGMVERSGDAHRITDAMDSTRLWLDKHKGHPDVRGAWLELATGAGSAIELATVYTWATAVTHERPHIFLRKSIAFVRGAAELQNGRIESAARHFAQAERLNRRLMRLGRARFCLFLRARLQDQLQLRGKQHVLWQQLHEEIIESGTPPNLADLQRAYERMVNRPQDP